jgi:hypothetical protein
MDTAAAVVVRGALQLMWHRARDAGLSGTAQPAGTTLPAAQSATGPRVLDPIDLAPGTSRPGAARSAVPSGRIMRSSSGDSLLGQCASDGDSASAMLDADGTCTAAAAAVMALLHKHLQSEAAAAAVKIGGRTG